MVKAAAVFTFVAILMLSFVPGAQALQVVTDLTWTWECLANCGSFTSGTAVHRDPRPPLWAAEVGSALWITAANDTTIPLNSVIEYRTDVQFGTGSNLNITIWADDTAGVSLDGGTLTFVNPGAAPGSLPTDAACVTGVLGCEQDEGGVFTSNTLTGSHTLRVQVHNLVAGTSSGTLAVGETVVVPEPATILLLGSALATAGVVSRRRFRKSQSPKA